MFYINILLMLSFCTFSFVVQHLLNCLSETIIQAVPAEFCFFNHNATNSIRGFKLFVQIFKQHLLCFVSLT